MHVLFVTYGGGHITMVAPVTKMLQSRGIRCTVIALTTGYQKAIQLGLQPLAYRDFMHLADRPISEVLETGRKNAEGNRNPSVDEAETYAYLGINLLDLVADHGEERARQIYQERGRQIFLPRRFMTRVLEHLRPDAVVVTNSPRSEQAALEAAVSLSIPVLSMTDLFIDPADPYCKRTVHADRITVIGARVARQLVLGGVEEHRIAVTGNPAFDSLAAPELMMQAENLRAQRGWQGKRVVLYAGHAEMVRTPPYAWVDTQFGLAVEERLRAWTNHRADTVFVARYHPSDAHLFPRLADTSNAYRSEPSTEPLHPLLLAADVVVVQTSTVGLEAALCGRAVISLSYAASVKETSFNYVQLGLSHGVDSLEELTAALDQSASFPRIDPSAYHVGHATENVCAEIARLF